MTGVNTSPALPGTLTRDAHGRLVYTDPQGLVHVGVQAVRAFPIESPLEGLSIVGPDGHELAWVERWDSLPPPDRSLIAEELAQREFMPAIHRLVGVSTFSTPSTWTVDTDRGRTQFILKGEEDIGACAMAGCSSPTTMGWCFAFATSRAWTAARVGCWIVSCSDHPRAAATAEQGQALELKPPGQPDQPFDLLRRGAWGHRHGLADTPVHMGCQRRHHVQLGIRRDAVEPGPALRWLLLLTFEHLPQPPRMGMDPCRAPAPLRILPSAAPLRGGHGLHARADPIGIGHADAGCRRNGQEMRVPESVSTNVMTKIRRQS